MLTIAMATYRDFSGVYFTIQGLKLYHPKVEILVLDNAPTSCDQTKGITLAAGGTYHHRPDLAGTSASRDALFRLAKTDWVAVVDSHILFDEGSVQKLLDYIAANPDSRDLITGPLLNDNHQQCHTHWRPACDNCLWGEWDFDPQWKESEIFEIPMQGLGLFVANRHYWPGFNQYFRGFGGEEGYIHQKYRQRGRKVLCMSGVQWVHRFRGSADPAPYQVNLKDHTTNLLVGHRELGIEKEDKIFEHFGSRLTREEWIDAKITAIQVQPLSTGKPLKILGVWYTNNAAPDWCLQASLQSIKKARDVSRFAVEVQTSVWEAIPGNPFDESLSPHYFTGHRQILTQIRDCYVNSKMVKNADVICFLEHDVLYPHDYFDRVGEAFLNNPDASVVSNLDYEGLNGSGWLAVKERHEPMHQLSMRLLPACRNLDRAMDDCDRQGWAYLEPQGDRADWVRLPYYGIQPAIHINHDKRFTSHGEVCYEASSNGKLIHRYWGDFRDYWKGPIIETQTKPQGCGCQSPQQAAQNDTIESRYAQALVTSTDINEHMPTLRELASNCDHVTELSCWINGAAIAIAYGNPKQFHSIAPGPKPEWDYYLQNFPGFTSQIGIPGEIEIQPTDMLFVDTVHTGMMKNQELFKYASKVSRYIVLHDTATYGDTGQDGQPGILAAVRGFLKMHPEWLVIRNDTNNNGLMVLSKDPADKKKVPSLTRQAFNYAKAMAKHVAGGRRAASEEETAKRVELCLLCPERVFDACGLCGCPIEAKTALATEKCPADKWQAI